MELTEGLNTVKLTTEDTVHGLPGYATFTVTVTLPDDEPHVDWAELVFPHPPTAAVPDSAVLSYAIGGVLREGITVTETGPGTFSGPGVIAHLSGEGESFTLSVAEPGGLSASFPADVLDSGDGTAVFYGVNQNKSH